MSGRSKVVSDKTEFLNFQPDKCPMSGTISRLEMDIYATINPSPLSPKTVFTMFYGPLLVKWI